MIDWFRRYVNFSRVILWLEVKESRSLHGHIYIILSCCFLGVFLVHMVLSNTDNF